MSFAESILRVEELMGNEESLKEKILRMIERENISSISSLFSLCQLSLFTPTHDDELNESTNDKIGNIYLLHQILSKGDVYLLNELIKKENKFKKKLASLINTKNINIETLAIYSSNNDVFEICLNNISDKNLKAFFINRFSKNTTGMISKQYYKNLSILFKRTIDKGIISEQEINNLLEENVDVDITVLNIFFEHLDNKKHILFNGLNKILKKEKDILDICSYGNLPPSQHDILRKKEELSILQNWLNYFSEENFKEIYDIKSQTSLYDFIYNNFDHTPLYNIVLNNGFYFNIAKANINSNIKVIIKNNRI